MAKELAVTGGIKDLITSDEAKKQFALALPKHLTPDRFIQVALTAFNRTPKLVECTKESLFQCLLDCSQLGLEPDGRRAHLIPYGNKCTLIIDYKGLVELARRSGEIADVHADVVCENDRFSYSFGTEGKLEHIPAMAKRGKPVAAYSFVKLKDGSSSFEVMNKEEVEAIQKRSKAKDNGPWKTDWAEMAKKTVFRRHSKWLPVSSEKFKMAIEADFDVAGDIHTTAQVAGKPDVDFPTALPPTKETSKPEAPSAGGKVTPEQVKLINIQLRKGNVDDGDFRQFLFGIGVEVSKAEGRPSSKNIPAEKVNDVLEFIRKNKKDE